MAILHHHVTHLDCREIWRVVGHQEVAKTYQNLIWYRSSNSEPCRVCIRHSSDYVFCPPGTTSNLSTSCPLIEPMKLAGRTPRQACRFSNISRLKFYSMTCWVWSVVKISHCIVLRTFDYFHYADMPLLVD